ncbi:MAG TPA: putative metalloprotease CJM1_0395 family protein [Dongiaceae bacterium]|jgi:hypothetical protein|nr:putative metalloprotease CJM1_0395 family protein [Dongiaceae bacterium]
MATIGSIVDGGRALVVGVIPGRGGTPERLVTRPVARQADDPQASKAPDAATGPGRLSPAEKRAVAELQERDREVRNEEERHKAAAGKFAGQPQYVYRRGPDGKLYAVEGKVPVNVNVTGTAEDRTAALRRVEAAAVSVQSPSSGDFKAVATAATAITAQQDPARPSDAQRRAEAEEAYRARQAAAADGSDDLARRILGLLA